MSEHLNNNDLEHTEPYQEQGHMQTARRSRLRLCLALAAALIGGGGAYLYYDAQQVNAAYQDADFNEDLREINKEMKDDTVKEKVIPTKEEGDEDSDTENNNGGGGGYEPSTPPLEKALG